MREANDLPPAALKALRAARDSFLQLRERDPALAFRHLRQAHALERRQARLGVQPPPRPTPQTPGEPSAEGIDPLRRYIVHEIRNSLFPFVAGLALLRDRVAQTAAPPLPAKQRANIEDLAAHTEALRELARTLAVDPTARSTPVALGREDPADSLAQQALEASRAEDHDLARRLADRLLHAPRASVTSLATARLVEARSQLAARDLPAAIASLHTCRRLAPDTPVAMRAAALLVFCQRQRDRNLDVDQVQRFVAEGLARSDPASRALAYSLGAELARVRSDAAGHLQALQHAFANARSSDDRWLIASLGSRLCTARLLAGDPGGAADVLEQAHAALPASASAVRRAQLAFDAALVLAEVEAFGQASEFDAFAATTFAAAGDLERALRAQLNRAGHLYGAQRHAEGLREVQRAAGQQHRASRYVRDWVDVMLAIGWAEVGDARAPQALARARDTPYGQREPLASELDLALGRWAALDPHTRNDGIAVLTAVVDRHADHDSLRSHALTSLATAYAAQGRFDLAIAAELRAQAARLQRIRSIPRDFARMLEELQRPDDITHRQRILTRHLERSAVRMGQALVDFRASLDALNTDASDPGTRLEVQELRRAHDRLRELTSEIQHIGHTLAMPPAPQPVDLATLCAEVVAQRTGEAERKAQRLYARCHAAVVHGVAGRLYSAIDNLVHNAIKFSPRHAQVRVEVCVVGKEVTIEVTDDGPGLTPEDQARAFRHIGRLTAKPTQGEPSTGMGLHFVKWIVDAHGGRVWASSEGLGMGSRFGFALPLASEA